MAVPYRVCRVEELPVGSRRTVEVGGRSIGVFNVNGSLHAIRNVCPHQMAPLCEGRVSGTTLPSKVGEWNYGMEGRVIRCPWHGWEFDLATGKSVFNPHKVRVKCYEVAVQREDGTVGSRSVAEGEEDPTVETYEVKVEEAWVVVMV